MGKVTVRIDLEEIKKTINKLSDREKELFLAFSHSPDRMINFLNIKKRQNVLEFEISFHSANLFGTLGLMASVLSQIRL